MKRTLLLITLSSWLSLCAAPMAAESPWPMFRHDRKHTGRTIYTGPATPTLYWTFQANDAVTASVSIGHNGTLYVGAGGYYTGGGDSSLYALNPDGTLKWQFKTDMGNTDFQRSGIFSSAAIGDDGTIYVGSLDAHLYAIEDSISYGKMKWRTNLGDWPVYGSPVIADDGIIYVGALSFRVHGINPDGSIRWWYPLGWCVFSSPALRDDGLVVIGSKDHNVTCFRDSIPYGSIVWQAPLGAFYDGHLIDCSPAIGEDGTIYVGTDGWGASGMDQDPLDADTNFFAINPDGSRKWSFPMGGCESTPALGPDGTIYAGSYDSCVYALEDMGAHAVQKWKFKTGGQVDASPTVDGDGTVYIGSRDGVMYALRPEDGSVKWSYTTGGGIESSATIDGDGYLYFGSFDGKLYALGAGSPDMGTVSVNLPQEVEVNADYSPTATIRNYRASNQSLQAICLIEDNGTPVYGDTISVSDAPGGGAKTIGFDTWTVGPDTGVVYDVTVITLLAADENAANDTAFGVVQSAAGAVWVCGDMDGSGDGPDISDLVYLVDYMFTGGPPPPIVAAADVDGSGAIDISDLVYIVDYMFTGGPPPVCS